MTEKLSGYNHFFQTTTGLRVVYNSLSGAVVRLDSRNWAQIRTGQVQALSPKVTDILSRQGVLVSAQQDELKQLMGKYERRRQSRNKLMLTIAPTLDCNFDCPYCYESRQKGRMDGKTANQLLTFIENRIRFSQEVSVTRYGGEPLLAAGTVLTLTKQIRSLVESRGKTASFLIVTNGYLLTPEQAKKLVAAGISGIQITLDGPPDVHNRRRMLRGGGKTFDRLLESIRIAISMFDSVKVRMNLDSENHSGWANLIGILEQTGLLGKVNFEIANVDATNEMNEGYKSQCLNPELFSAEWVNFATSSYRRGDAGPLKLPKMTVCTKIADWSYVIAPGGEIYGCWNDVGDRGRQRGQIGDPDSLDKNRDWARFTPLDWPECRECSILPACMGRCPDLLEKQGPESACGQWKHCLREAVILHTISTPERRKNGKSGKQFSGPGTGTTVGTG